jgi:hypothetical protein
VPETVDPDWAKSVLTWWIEHGIAALKINPGARSPERASCQRGPQTDALFEREIQTRRVIGVVLGIENVEALIRPTRNLNYVELRTGIDFAQRALGHLTDAAETEKYIQGTSAPTMSADSLHPLVWDAAAKLWRDEHYSSAVQRAATFLNAHVQDLSDRRDVSDSVLMAQVFSPNPPEEGRPRLRWPGDDTDLAVKAMRTGLLHFSQGCFAAIRNRATHSTSDMSSQEALEQLAILSTLARWIDQCDLLEVETP